MIKFEDAKIAFARSIYDLLTDSDGQEWFSTEQIAKRAGVKVGRAFANRILNLSMEEDDTFSSFDDNDDVRYWTLGKEGFDLVETSELAIYSNAEGEAPASDRIVQFNHNAPNALEVAEQLAQVTESVRGANGPEIDEQERARVFSALKVAKEVWESAHFRLIQLKIGVLLAVEDAAALLSKTSKHAAAALLIDAIKAFAKNHFHADLDKI